MNHIERVVFSRVSWDRTSDWTQLAHYDSFVVQRYNARRFEVGRCALALEQPSDCGRMEPPTGPAGIAYWMRVDPTVFMSEAELRAHLRRLY